MSDSEVVPSPEARRAAYDFIISQAIRHAEKVAIAHPEDIVPFFEGLFRESERATGILAFAYIESRVQELFGQHLDSAVQGGVDSIIWHNGILDSIGSQIKMLRALQWIRPETEHELRLLGRIRNRFAHAHSVLTFEDEKIRGYFSAMTKQEDKFAKQFPEKYGHLQLDVRRKYLVRAAFTVFALYADLTLMPASIHAGMDPTGAFSAGFDKYPQSLRYALGHCMDAVFAVYRDVESG